MGENICKNKKIGSVEIRITGCKVEVMHKGELVFSFYTVGLRLQELSGIIRDSLKYHGLDVAEPSDVIAGWIKGCV